MYSCTFPPFLPDENPLNPRRHRDVTPEENSSHSGNTPRAPPAEAGGALEERTEAVRRDQFRLATMSVSGSIVTAMTWPLTTTVGVEMLVAPSASGVSAVISVT